MSDAELARFIDRQTVEFVRVFPHPIERVWKAVSDPAEVAIWFIPPTVWDLKEGGRYRFHDDGFAGPILAFDPPRFVRFGATGWGEGGFFQFALEPAGEGTRLRYVQYLPAGIADPDEPDPDFGTPARPGALAGWHAAFDELGELLDGVPIGSRMTTTRFSRIAQDWAERFAPAEIAPELKARILKGLRGRERWFDLTDTYRAHVRATRPPPAKP